MPASAQLPHAAIADFLKHDSTLWTALMAAGQEAEDYWKSIAPVGDKEHALKSGYVDHPGDYRNSIRHKMMHNPTRMKVRVEATDFKAHWIEYGTSKMPAQAPMAKTRDYMRAHGFSS
ncbi:hypothetical protein G4X40_19745 [Rhodococcus sp. D2-41]|uniref:Uncharacterized protein n=1 Tax=Speluncibacter jeojiensis TaxID=2710754 RepID=A0A9X4RCG6_9ACTN|nr:hypothetical protein [Rhodococcus sp. D2-41]MDG3012377.1 hypothetical protein [Rhodococcus sp. D2-41]MDG3013549.1 hypothetical protein [Corynebacteriales bacterium D3-21]